MRSEVPLLPPGFENDTTAAPGVSRHSTSVSQSVVIAAPEAGTCSRLRAGAGRTFSATTSAPTVATLPSNQSFGFIRFSCLSSLRTWGVVAAMASAADGDYNDDLPIHVPFGHRSDLRTRTPTPPTRAASSCSLRGSAAQVALGQRVLVECRRRTGERHTSPVEQEDMIGHAEGLMDVLLD